MRPVCFDVDRAVAMFQQDGMTCQQIAWQMKVSPDAVWYHMRKRGVPVRGLTPRVKQILDMIDGGARKTEVAAAMHLSPQRIGAIYRMYGRKK